MTSAMTDLRRAALGALPAGIRRPGYDPADVTAGIVHLGLGGFHRAHMARYTHALMEADPAALGWGILGAGLLPGDRPVIESLAPQDGLYTLVEREGGEEEAAVIGSLAGIVFAGEGTEALLDAIDDPAIRIVSLTVTEDGYCLDPATKAFDPGHPLVRADLADPARPKSAIGVLVAALRRRRSAGRPAFTPLTCDNIQGNGHVLRAAVLAQARLREPALADWIEREVRFPSTMVDRITPRTTPADIAALASRYGLHDRWPVVCERFTQWVIEDDFTAGRPEWERVGAQFVADVAPYEMMKLRLLNASHLAVSGLGRLAGCVTIDESMADPRIAEIMRAMMERETGSTLPEIPGIDLAAYRRRLMARFANTAIRDTVDRVNTDAPLNVLLDPIRDRLAAGAPLELLALALAAWLYRMRGEDERGRPIELRHPMLGILKAKAGEGGPDPTPLLSIRPLFGALGENPRLLDPVRRWLGLLYGSGIEAVLDAAARLG